MSIFKCLERYWCVEDKARLYPKTDFERGRSNISTKTSNAFLVGVVVGIFVMCVLVLLGGVL